jgi:hypothetical protein
MKMGWRDAFATGAEADSQRLHLPLRRRYPIIVKSGKDIQPFFTNRSASVLRLPSGF